MASSGTILPSISTFSNQKEKYWEDVSWPFLFINCCFHRASCTCLPAIRKHISISCCFICVYYTYVCIDHLNGLKEMMHSETNCAPIPEAEVEKRRDQQGRYEQQLPGQKRRRGPGQVLGSGVYSREHRRFQQCVGRRDGTGVIPPSGFRAVCLSATASHRNVPSNKRLHVCSRHEQSFPIQQPDGRAPSLRHGYQLPPCEQLRYSGKILGQFHAFPDHSGCIPRAPEH